MKPQPTIEDIIAIQREQLNDWKVLLKPKIYKDLEKWATEKNHLKTDPYHIIRGSDLANFIYNYTRNYTPPN